MYGVSQPVVTEDLLASAIDVLRKNPALAFAVLVGLRHSVHVKVQEANVAGYGALAELLNLDLNFVAVGGSWPNVHCFGPVGGSTSKYESSTSALANPRCLTSISCTSKIPLSVPVPKRIQRLRGIISGDETFSISILSFFLRRSLKSVCFRSYGALESRWPVGLVIRSTRLLPALLSVKSYLP